jgi:hypothetical protein
VEPPRHRGGAARGGHPGRVDTEHAGQLRRGQGGGITPGARVQGAPGQDRELHALPLTAVGHRPVHPRPRPEPPPRQLPLAPQQRLDDLVVLRQPLGALRDVRVARYKALARIHVLIPQRERQPEPLRRGSGQHDQRVAVAAELVQPRRTQPGFRKRPRHQLRQRRRRALQNQTTGRVRDPLAIQNRQRTMRKPTIRPGRRCGGDGGGGGYHGTGPTPQSRTGRRTRQRGGVLDRGSDVLGRRGRTSLGRQDPLHRRRGGSPLGRGLSERRRDGSRGGSRSGHREALRPTVQQPLVRRKARRPRLRPARLPVLHRLRRRRQGLGHRGLRHPRRLPQPRPLSRPRQQHLRTQQERIHRREQLILRPVRLRHNPPPPNLAHT